MESSDLPAIPYNLKHFHRRPLRFSELSQRLKLRIVKKHPASTQLKLVEASFSVSLLVEIVHSEIPRVNMAQNFLESFSKNDLLHPNQATDCFPFKEKLVFKDWASNCLLGITSGPHAEGREFKEFYQQPPYSYKHEYQYSLGKLWDADQRIGPAWLNWTYLPRNMKQEILLKTSLLAASRLACTSVIGREAVLTCVKSVKLLEIRDETWPSNCCPKIFGTRHIYSYIELLVAPLCFTYKDANSRPTADTKALHDATKRRDLRNKKLYEKMAKRTKYQAPLGYTKVSLIGGGDTRTSYPGVGREGMYLPAGLHTLSTQESAVRQLVDNALAAGATNYRDSGKREWQVYREVCDHSYTIDVFFIRSKDDFRQ